MLKEWLKMKRQEIAIKSCVYRTILTVTNEKSEIIDLIKNLYSALKDVPVDELRSEFINNLAHIIHDENSKKTK